MADDDSTDIALVDATCRHHWDIEPPSGDVSQGTCRLCGAKKQFHNSNSWQKWVSPTKRTQEKA